MSGRLPRRLLHLEGLAVLVASLALYFDAGYGWLLLVVLFLAPDVSTIGYLAGPSVGAVTYDVVHTYVWPIALGVVGVLGDSGSAVQIALIWTARGSHARLRAQVPDRVQGHAHTARLRQWHAGRSCAGRLLEHSAEVDGGLLALYRPTDGK